VRYYGHIVTGDELRDDLAKEKFIPVAIPQMDLQQPPDDSVLTFGKSAGEIQAAKAYTLQLKAVNAHNAAERAKHKAALAALALQLSKNFLICSFGPKGLFFEDNPKFNYERFAQAMEKITTYPLDWICYKYHDEL